jgi:hypothetical protein
MFALYIVGVILGFIGSGVMLWWLIISVKTMRRQKREELNILSNEGGLKGLYRPFVIWLYAFIFFALLLVGIFSATALGMGTY